MNISIVACTSALLIPLFVNVAIAQSSNDQLMADMPKIELPAACKKDGTTGDHMAMGQQMMQQMQGASANMNDANMGYMKAMMAMHQPMMEGATVPDADIAFNCAMIAHHQGAIEMAKVQLQHGKDEQSKEMAQKTIDQQGKEVEEMTKWLEEHASK